MKSRFVYYFDWDDTQAAVSSRLHAITFKEAVTLFHDPLALSCRDEMQSGISEHWITLGQTRQAGLVVVVHTFQSWSPREAQVRIISARKATEDERHQYACTHRIQEPNMYSQYDFSLAERGKFFREGATFEIPIYLRPDVLEYYTARADEDQIDVSELINDVLAREMELIKGAGG